MATIDRAPEQLKELALFAGAGGGILGGKLLNWRTVCAVEIDAYCAKVLAARQNDGTLQPFPIWDDIRTFDGKPWRGIVDVVSGGFPCQDISTAGKGAGLDGERSGLWREMSRIIREVMPSYAFIENSPALAGRGLSAILKDLALGGYDAKWGVVGACHVGAPHKRHRLWIRATRRDVANAVGVGRRREALPEIRRDSDDRQQDLSPPLQKRQDVFSEPIALRDDVSDADSAGRKEQRGAKSAQAELKAAECSGWWKVEPAVGRVANGLASRVDRLKALGNGQVPTVAAAAWEILK